MSHPLVMLRACPRSQLSTASPELSTRSITRGAGACRRTHRWPDRRSGSAMAFGSRSVRRFTRSPARRSPGTRCCSPACSRHGCQSWASHATANHLWALKGFDQPEAARAHRAISERSSASTACVVGGPARCSTVTSRCRHGIPTVTGRARAHRRVLAAHRRTGSVESSTTPCGGGSSTSRSSGGAPSRLLPAPGRSMSKVHAVLGARIPGYDPGDSDLETRALRALTAAGLPPPKQQHRMRPPRPKVRIDLAYPDLKIAIELDSWKYHGGDNLTAFTDDRARKNDLDRAGLGRAELHRVDDRRVLRLRDPRALRRSDCVARASHSALWRRKRSGG